MHGSSIILLVEAIENSTDPYANLLGLFAVYEPPSLPLHVSIGISRYGCPETEGSAGTLCVKGRKFQSPRLRLGVSSRLPCQTPLCPPRPREPLTSPPTDVYCF